MWNNESSMWKVSSTKALTRRAQLKYIDVGKMKGEHERQVRSRTNKKSDKVEIIVTACVKH